jgi:predicted dehydrogenase
VTVRVGVVGAGSMGRNHARVYSQLADAELVGVADADHDTAEAVAATYATSVSDVTELCEEADAVSIAVPTAQHADVARRCITAGLAVLVEKPFVAEAASGEALIELATAHDCVLQVGHIERFNPAVEAAAAILAGHGHRRRRPHDPRRRCGAVAARGTGRRRAGRGALER